MLIEYYQFNGLLRVFSLIHEDDIQSIVLWFIIDLVYASLATRSSATGSGSISYDKEEFEKK